MKYTKHALALLLALALAFGLAMTAFATEEEAELEPLALQSTVDWSEFRIITNPQDQYVPYGESFTLSVEVNIPDGGEVTYRWYVANGGIIEGATTNTLQLGPGDAHYPKPPGSNDAGLHRRSYRCVIIPADGQARSRESWWADVEVEGSDWGKLCSVTNQPPQELYVPRGKSFALSAEVDFPEGHEVTYQWYEGRYDSPIKGATARTLQLGPRDAGYPTYTSWHETSPGVSFDKYYCLITVTNSDDGQAITLRTSRATVYVGGALLHKLYGVTLDPFVIAFWVSWDNFGFVPISLLFPFVVITRYIANFKALFLF